MTTNEMSQTERWKEQIRQEWAAIAEVWRKWHPQFVLQTRGATEAILQAAQPKPGMQVLDLASGTGEPSLSLSIAVAPEGRVTATDLVTQMLAVAEENARKQGLTNIGFQQADAESLPFPDQSFDLVTCRFGVMFFPNTAQALQEIRRVLKPGGRVAFVAWGPMEQNPFFASTVGVFAKYVQTPPPQPGAPTPFRFAQAGSLETALKEADFKQVQEEYRTIPWNWPGTPEQIWEFLGETGRRGAFTQVMGSLAPDLREQVAREVLENIWRSYDGQQVNFSATIVVASAMR